MYRVVLKDDTLITAALDYGWYVRAMNAHALAGLSAAFDDRRNVAIASSTDAVRGWLAKAPDEAFATPATYTRASAH